MQLSYARATVSEHDVTINRIWASCLYLKKQYDTLQKYSVSDPTIGGHANANTSNHELGTYL